MARQYADDDRAEPASDTSLKEQFGSLYDDPIDDPIRAALDAAPPLALSDEDRAELHEIERSTTKWTSHDEVISALAR